MTIRFLVEALLYSVFLGAYITISQLFNPRLWLRSYPESIRTRVPSPTGAEKKAKLAIGIPFLIFMAGYPIFSTVRLAASPEGISIGTAFLNTFGIAMSFCLFDLLILDWLVFCFITPRYLIVPGSEDSIGDYKNYRHHLRGLYVGGVLSIILGGIAVLLVAFPG